MDALALKSRQWKGLFLTYLQDGLAYRAQGFIWVLTDAVTALIMPQVWLSTGQGQTINGYSPSDFVLYYLCMLLITSFVTSHFMWDIGVEIREGVFTTHLLRPINYLEFMIVRNFSWRIIRTLLFLPLFIIFAISYSSQVTSLHLHLGWETWLAILLGHLVSICFVTALGMIALFTEEAQTIFEIYYMPALFLSGQLFPVSLLPGWVQAASKCTPFYYSVAGPTELLIGQLPPSQAPGMMAAQMFWVGASVVLYRVLFSAGMKRYSGVGM